MKRLALVGLALALTSACTGLSMGENKPGADTWLENGSIAVDPITETSFVMRTTGERLEGTGSPTEPGETKTLYAVPPDEGGAIKVAELSDMSDVRMLFPGGAVMVMGEVGGVDQLRLFDRDGLGELTRVSTHARYNGTRMAPGRRWIAVADNSRTPSPIEVIDTETMLIETIPHNGEWLEAMWLNGRDTLCAIVFYDQYSPSARARIMTWSIDELALQGFMAVEGLWADPELDITVEDASGDLLFSYTWVGVAPDDGYAVFPVRSAAAGTPEDWGYRLLVVDLASGDVRAIDDARGPVGFTPDSSTIVSYRYLPDGSGGTTPALLLIDAETLEAEELEIPFDGGPQYFVSHEGNFVVVAGALGEQDLVLYDLDRHEVTRLGGPHIGLHEFVSRLGHGELWLVDDGLHRLDFMSASLETVHPGFVPEHINILPTRDRLVLDDAATGNIRFYDLASRTVVRTVELQ